MTSCVTNTTNHHGRYYDIMCNQYNELSWEILWHHV